MTEEMSGICALWMIESESGENYGIIIMINMYHYYKQDRCEWWHGALWYKMYYSVKLLLWLHNYLGNAKVESHIKEYSNFQKSLLLNAFQKIYW